MSDIIDRMQQEAERDMHRDEQDEEEQPTTALDAGAVEVETLKAACDKLAEVLTAAGVQVSYNRANFNLAQPSLASDTLRALLIEKGIISQAEYDATFYRLAHDLLAVLLVKVEERQATAAKPQVQAVQKPAILVPNRNRRIH